MKNNININNNNKIKSAFAIYVTVCLKIYLENTFLLICIYFAAISIASSVQVILQSLSQNTTKPLISWSLKAIKFKRQKISLVYLETIFLLVAKQIGYVICYYYCSAKFKSWCEALYY